MKKITIFGSAILLLSLLLVGCGGNKQNNTNNSTGNSGTTNTTSESDNTDYGKVSFKPIYVYADNVGNNFDEVPIRPIFTNPEVCQNEVFEYEIKDEDICYIENNHVYATGVKNGTTKVTAKSQHLKGTFIVIASDKFNNSGAFSKAKSLANTASHTTQQGTTLFVGASTWEFWKNKNNIDESFAEAFAGYDVANVGIAGTQAREWRSLRKKLIDPYEPENIVLHLGLNDIDDNNLDGESTAELIMLLCNDIWEKHPNCNIYYCTINRCAGTFASKWPYHSQCNEIMRTNSENIAKLHYLDIMAIYGDNYADYEQADGLHPNTAGYAAFKSVILANVPLKTLSQKTGP